jgi:hypothetical protein
MCNWNRSHRYDARAARLATTLRGRPTERARVIRELVQQVILDEQRIIVKVQPGALLGEPSDNTVELTAPSNSGGVAAKRSW